MNVEIKGAMKFIALSFCFLSAFQCQNVHAREKSSQIAPDKVASFIEVIQAAGPYVAKVDETPKKRIVLQVENKYPCNGLIYVKDLSDSKSTFHSLVRVAASIVNDTMYGFFIDANSKDGMKMAKEDQDFSRVRELGLTTISALDKGLELLIQGAPQDKINDVLKDIPDKCEKPPEVDDNPLLRASVSMV